MTAVSSAGVPLGLARRDFCHSESLAQIVSLVLAWRSDPAKLRAAEAVFPTLDATVGVTQVATYSWRSAWSDIPSESMATTRDIATHSQRLVRELRTIDLRAYHRLALGCEAEWHRQAGPDADPDLTLDARTRLLVGMVVSTWLQDPAKVALTVAAYPDHQPAWILRAAALMLWNTLLLQEWPHEETQEGIPGDEVARRLTHISPHELDEALSQLHAFVQLKKG